MSPKMSRREFLKFAGITAASTVLGACLPRSAPPASLPVSTSTAAPALLKHRTVTIQLNAGPAFDTSQVLLTNPLFTDFTKQTGIEIQFVPRPGMKDAELVRLKQAVEAGTSPYDILDFEDELTTSFSRAGYMLPLNDLLPNDFWSDFPPEMKAYSDAWSTHKGDLFRVVHNWEIPYWWYRKDWFDSKGVAVPTTWEQVRGLGKVFTDEGTGVWATEDGLTKGGYMNVYLAWITLQAGGNPYEAGDQYKTALQYIYDLMHSDKVLNPVSMDRNFYLLMNDYLADKVAFMRQWPSFYEVSRDPANAGWFKEEKAVVALPPVGPGGKGGSTYAASWGFGIVKTAPNLEAAKEVLKFLVLPEVAAEMARVSFWYVSARKSVLAALGDKGVAKLMKMYTDAGVVGVRPYHPRFFEALTVIENTATDYLTDKINLDESLKQARQQLAQLE